MRKSTSNLLRGLTWLSGFLAAGYTLLVRPWMARWGSTYEEVHWPLPGDELVSEPELQATRAITIHAPTRAIWPWLMQMGLHRAGWYTPAWGDRVWNTLTRRPYRKRLQTASPLAVDPELQCLSVGDKLLGGPEGTLVVKRLETNRSLVLLAVRNPFSGKAVDPEASFPGPYVRFSWAFILDPISGSKTRLVIRVRARFSRHWRIRFFRHVFLEPGDFLMERAMLRGIRERAESSWREESAG